MYLLQQLLGSNVCLHNISITFSEPPFPPTNVRVIADSAESITVTWSEPEVTNGRISNYSVTCSYEGMDVFQRVVNELQPRVVTEFFLEPNSTYNCSVIAVNVHGQSRPTLAVGTTPPRTSKHSDLLLDGHLQLMIMTISH